MGVISDGFDLGGRVAIVTGAASGIGRATAELLGEAGAAIMLADVDEAGVQRAAAELGERGVRCCVSVGDSRLRATADQMVGRAVDELGRLDILCNVAGVPCDVPLGSVDDDEIDRMIGINLKGVLYGCQAAFPAMVRSGGGSIVNVSSTGIDVPQFGNGLYATTKAAVAMMTMALAAEFGPNGVRVNAIAPGATLTNFTQRHLYDERGSRDEEKFAEFVERMRAFSPLGLVGEAIDQAFIILYLVSPAARYTTGNIFRVNGGQSMAW